MARQEDERTRSNREAMKHQESSHGITFVGRIPISSVDDDGYAVIHHVPGSEKITSLLTQEPSSPIVWSTVSDPHITNDLEESKLKSALERFRQNGAKTDI